MEKNLLVADVLGFTRIVSNLSGDPSREDANLDERIRQWIKLVNETKTEHHIRELRLISDTVFALENGSKNGLRRLLRFARSLLETGLKHSFPVRGAITRGAIHWGELIYGKPVIEALHHEKSQDWIGISCTPGMRIPWSWDLVCCYPVPKKRGMIQLLPSVVWTIPERTELEKLTGTGGLLAAKDPIPWEIQSKLINTLLFSKYILVGRHLNLEPKTFRFETPAHLFSDADGLLRSSPG